MDDPSLSPRFISKLTNRYIGVSEGYLGDFNRRVLRDFYCDYCDLDIDLDLYEGTTRERFIEILLKAETEIQAKILRGILDKFIVGDRGAPASRTEELKSQIEAVIKELERVPEVDCLFPTYNIEVVNRAISDAETLLKTNGPTRAIDRIHTALHGFLLKVCRDARITLSCESPPLPSLFKSLREGHPAFREIGPRSQDILHILRAVGSILDVMNPLRNQASMAHPNDDLLPPEEAMLVINVSRSILNYLVVSYVS